MYSILQTVSELIEHERLPIAKDRGRERLSSSPPSELCVRFPASGNCSKLGVNALGFDHEEPYDFSSEPLAGFTNESNGHLEELQA